MNIPLVDLTFNAKPEKEKISQAIKKVLSKGDFILGQEVKKFENNFAEYIGVKYCVSVASGSDALFLSLKALGIKKNDEVIIPAMTFIATASTVLPAGATPIFVDILPNLPLIDPSKIEQKITKKTKAIIPVHLYGYPCDMRAIEKIAKKYNLYILEDACQSHGSFYKNKHTGSFGNAAAFSFYPSKNLGAYGDAGAITTSDKKLAERLYSLRNHGHDKKSSHTIVGYNSRLDTIQAAILNIKIKYIDAQNVKRRKNAALYTNLLKHLPIRLLKASDEMLTNYHIYAIQVKKRDKLIAHLKTKNINCGIHYPLPLHLQPALSFLQYKKGDFIYAEKLANETLSLPMYPELTPAQIQYICKEVELFYKK